MILYAIDKSKRPKKLSLSLAKPNKKIIANIVDRQDENLKIKFGKINELSFTVPTMVEFKHKLIDNPILDKLKERYLVRSKFGDSIEWFVITKKRKLSDDSDKIQIECFSLGYELSYQRIKNYEVISYNLQQVATDCLTGTNWKIGYINSKFNLLYRQFLI
jgi:hypothetical protein